MNRSEKFLHPMKSPERRAAEQYLSRAAQVRQYRPGALVVVERIKAQNYVRRAARVEPMQSGKGQAARELRSLSKRMGVKPAMLPADRVMPVRIRGKREQAILGCGRWLNPLSRIERIAGAHASR